MLFCVVHVASFLLCLHFSPHVEARICCTYPFALRAALSSPPSPFLCTTFQLTHTLFFLTIYSGRGRSHKDHVETVHDVTWTRLFPRLNGRPVVIVPPTFGLSFPPPIASPCLLFYLSSRRPMPRLFSPLLSRAVTNNGPLRGRLCSQEAEHVEKVLKTVGYL